MVFVLCARIAAAQEPEWKLVWSDEFDGSKLDYGKWEAEVNAFGGSNQELQIFTDCKENLRVENGQLIMNLSIGGSFVGPPNAETQFPRQFAVDYVRVYQRS